MKNKFSSKLKLYCQQLIITCQTEYTLHCGFNSPVVLHNCIPLHWMSEPLFVKRCTLFELLSVDPGI